VANQVTILYHSIGLATPSFTADATSPIPLPPDTSGPPSLPAPTPLPVPEPAAAKSATPQTLEAPERPPYEGLTHHSAGLSTLDNFLIPVPVRAIRSTVQNPPSSTPLTHTLRALNWQRRCAGISNVDSLRSGLGQGRYSR